MHIVMRFVLMQLGRLVRRRREWYICNSQPIPFLDFLWIQLGLEMGLALSCERASLFLYVRLSLRGCLILGLGIGTKYPYFNPVVLGEKKFQAPKRVHHGMY